MSKIVFVSPSNTAKMLLAEAMVRYAHRDDTLVFIDAASKGDLDANIAALVANQDIIYVAGNIADDSTCITTAQKAALQAKLKAVTGELINYTSTDQTAAVDMAYQAWTDLFDGNAPTIVFLTSDKLDNLTHAEEVQGEYLKLAIKARYYGNLGTQSYLYELYSLLDKGFLPDSGFTPAHISKALTPQQDMALLHDMTLGGMLISKHEAAKSGYIYINSFSMDVDGETWTGVIDDLAGTIAISIPYGSVVTNLIADYIASDFTKVYVGEEEQQSGVSKNDFTSPVTYTVLAEAGGVKSYTATVSLNGGSSEADFLAFTIPNQVGDTTIDTEAKTVALTMPFGTNPAALVAAFTTSDKVYSVVVGVIEQESETTANDFTNPVNYVITAQNGDTKTFTITVAIAGA